MMNTTVNSGACRPVTERTGNKIDENNIPLLTGVPVGCIALPMSRAYGERFVGEYWRGRCLVVDPAAEIAHGQLAVTVHSDRTSSGGSLVRLDLLRDPNRPFAIQRGFLGRVGRTLRTGTRTFGELSLGGIVVGEVEDPDLVALAEEAFDEDIRLDLEAEEAAASNFDAEAYIRLMDSAGSYGIVYMREDGEPENISFALISSPDDADTSAIYAEQRSIFDQYGAAGSAGNQKIADALVRMNRVYVTYRSGAGAYHPGMPADLRAKLDQWHREIGGAA